MALCATQRSDVMQAFSTPCGLTAAAIATLALAPAAHAVELEQLLGRWSSLELDECIYPADSEAAPLQVRQEGNDIWIGNYGWLCSVPVTDWKKDGDFLSASARACGQEGGDDTFDQDFLLGLSADDRLLMARDDKTGLRRCPAAAE